MKSFVTKSLPFACLLAFGTVAVQRPANTMQEHHPHIRAAVNELREAREELRTAAHDFCGHRVAAMADTQKALNQLQAALACDRK